MSAQITIARTASRDIQLRQIILTLDDKPLAKLKFGERVMRTIDPGPHRLRADNTFQKKTLAFNLAPDEHAQFMAINRAGRLSWFLIFAFGAGPVYVELERMVT